MEQQPLTPQPNADSNSRQQASPIDTGRNMYAAPAPQFVCPLAGKVKRRSIFWMLIKFLLIVFLIGFIIAKISGIAMSGKFEERPYGGTNPNERIALIDLAESITMDSPVRIRQMLQQAQQDSTIKGVILVVNCPGGQVVPSEIIQRYLNEFNKPIYTCIEQLGASGAYWAAMGTDRIYAQTNSIVGSIGVIYMQFVLQDALEEKLGIDPVIITSTLAVHKDRGSPFRQPTEQEVENIQEDLDTVHRRFVATVAQGRNMPEDAVWPLADGEVFDGPEAMANGLIDQLGFLDDVINDMAADLEIYDPQVVRYMPAPTVQDLLKASTQNSSPFNLEQIRHALSRESGIMAIWPGNR